MTILQKIKKLSESGTVRITCCRDGGFRLGYYVGSQTRIAEMHRQYGRNLDLLLDKAIMEAGDNEEKTV